MTISCGLCWNIDSRKIIWLPRAHFSSENESLKGLKHTLLDGLAVTQITVKEFVIILCPNVMLYIFETHSF